VRPVEKGELSPTWPAFFVGGEKMKNQGKMYEANLKLKSEGKAVLELETLESLRKTWFELGYEAGYRDGKAGKKKHYTAVDKAYDKVRGQHWEAKR